MELQLGMRVLVLMNDKNALIVGKPEYYRPNVKLVRIKYENSTRFEYMISNQLRPLPVDQQYPALGGTYVNPQGAF